MSLWLILHSKPRKGSSSPSTFGPGALEPHSETLTATLCGSGSECSTVGVIHCHAGCLTTAVAGAQITAALCSTHCCCTPVIVLSSCQCQIEVRVHPPCAVGQSHRLLVVALIVARAAAGVITVLPAAAVVARLRCRLSFAQQLSSEAAEQWAGVAGWTH